MSDFFPIRLTTTTTTRVVKWFSYSRFHMCPPGTWFLNGRTTATEMVGKRWSPVTEFSQEADGIIIIRQEGTVISFTENEFFCFSPSKSQATFLARAFK